MNKWKKRKVVMFPTDEKAEIIGNKHYAKEAKCGELRLRKDCSDNWINSFWKYKWINYHIYILSDEEIKEGDWFMIIDTGEILKTTKKVTLEVINNIEKDEKSWFKIVATTDTKLKLPSPSQEFIKKYCEVGGIDEVMVEYEEQMPLDKDLHMFVLKVSKDNTITIRKVKDSWSREEVERLLLDCNTEYMTAMLSDKVFNLRGWIEQNL